MVSVDELFNFVKEFIDNNIYDIENEEWFEALSQKYMGIVTEVFNSFATEKELYDFDQGINGLL